MRRHVGEEHVQSHYGSSREVRPSPAVTIRFCLLKAQTFLFSFSIGDTFEMYDLVRQDGRRQLKHPAGLEPEGRGLISYFRWTSSPPEEMVHHDYGLWDKNEVRTFHFFAGCYYPVSNSE